MSEEDMRREIEQALPGVFTNGSVTPDVVIPVGEQWQCEKCGGQIGPVASQNVGFTLTWACACGTIVELLSS